MHYLQIIANVLNDSNIPQVFPKDLNTPYVLIVFIRTGIKHPQKILKKSVRDTINIIIKIEIYVTNPIINHGYP